MWSGRTGKEQAITAPPYLSGRLLSAGRRAEVEKTQAPPRPTPVTAAKKVAKKVVKKAAKKVAKKATGVGARSGAVGAVGGRVWAGGRLRAVLVGARSVKSECGAGVRGSVICWGLASKQLHQVRPWVCGSSETTGQQLSKG